MNSDDDRRTIWLIQDGEPLPIDNNPRLMRTGDLARCLVEMGYSVIWWTSRFSHNLKRFRDFPDVWCRHAPHLTIALLDGAGYARNMSFRRIHHYRSLARHFAQLSQSLESPALILGSFPSPELCEAGRKYATQHNVPFVIDIRDPWPDIFPDYLPRGLRWSLSPVLWYYRRLTRAVARDANSILAVSNAMLEWGIAYSDREITELDKVFHIGFRRERYDRKISVPQHFTSEQPLICLFATTCGASYDGEFIIESARILEASRERRVRFVITGDGDMRDRWLAAAKGLSTVQFTGWISDQEMQRQFNSAHLGLVLLKGGIAKFWLGNKIFEYLSAYLGVINNVAGEPAEIVREREVGLNVERGDPASLASALRSLVTDPHRVQMYMENARAAFQGHFDRDVIQLKYANHLGSVIERSDAREMEVS